MALIGIYTDYMTDVHRFYNKISGTHFYTASETEKNRVIAELSNVFNYEGPVWSARREAYPGWMPVYRLYNRTTGVHFYTASDDELENIKRSLPQFKLEGVAYWVRSNEISIPGEWQAPSNVIPETGNYIYYESQNGDFVGQGEQTLWTSTNSKIEAKDYYQRFIELKATGFYKGDSWLYFPTSFSDWRVGLFTNASRSNWMSNSTTGPGLDFGMSSRGCNETSGWINVDSVTPDTDGTIASFELRFEQLCQHSRDVLRGKVRWSKYDTTLPPGPVADIPGSLWKPNPSVIPESGNFIYFEGDRLVYQESIPGVGGFVPENYNRLILGNQLESINIHTPQPVVATPNNGRLAGFAYVAGTNNNEIIQFEFRPMWFMSGLTKGFYGDVTRSPDPNPAKGSLQFDFMRHIEPSQAWGCGALQWSTGWFAVDDVTYQGSDIDQITLRFEINCSGYQNSTRGMIRWNFNE